MNIVRDMQIYQKIRENLGLTCLLILAALLRFLFLTLKAPHFDEGVYGFFVQEIWRRGLFPYDPSNFHGPSYYYALQVAEQVLGRGIFAYRFASGIFSMLTVYYVWRLNKFFGEVAIWAALAVAVSPAAVFYSRYAMHESMFVLFQVLFAHHYFDFIAKPNPKSACWIGIYTALLFATKETTIIFLFCFLFASLLVKIFERRKGLLTSLLGAQRIHLRWILLSIAVCFLAICFIFSGLGGEPQRIADFFRAYSFWAKTGTQHASGHEKPFIYWFELLVRYEWPAFVGLLVAPVLIILGSRPARFFGFFALGNLLAYAIIPYKTPWCILGIIWPLYFLMGFAMAKMRSFKFVQAIAISNSNMDSRLHYRSKRVSALLAIGLCAISLAMAIRLNFFHFQDSSEPYVYVQSSEDVNSIVEILKRRVQNFPEEINMSILVGLKATWPFPWTLSDFTHLSYREIFVEPNGSDIPAPIKEQKRLIETADVIMVDMIDEPKIEKQITRKYFKSQFKVRDSYNICTLYLNSEKFQLSDLSFAQARNLGGEISIMNFSSAEPKASVTQ